MSMRTMRASSKVLMFGMIFMVLGVTLFVFGLSVNADPAPGFERSELMSRVGQVSGGLAGVGALLLLVAGLMRSKGN